MLNVGQNVNHHLLWVLKYRGIFASEIVNQENLFFETLVAMNLTAALRTVHDFIDEVNIGIKYN